MLSSFISLGTPLINYKPLGNIFYSESMLLIFFYPNYPMESDFKNEVKVIP